MDRPRDKKKRTAADSTKTLDVAVRPLKRTAAESTKTLDVAVRPLKRIKLTLKSAAEKRKSEDLWRSVFHVGINSGDIDCINKFNWNFENLEEALEEGGQLYGKTVHFFGSTESQLLDADGELRIVHIPVVVAMAWDSDWEMDDYEEEFIHDKANNDVLAEEEKGILKEFLKEVRERNSQVDNSQTKEARKKGTEGMDPKEKKEAYANILFYKIYPAKSLDTPDLSSLKVKYINRLYRNAHHLM